jgi:uncharacterized protein
VVKRILELQIEEVLRQNKSILLLGPRQIGKSTLLSQFKSGLSLNFSKTSERLRYEKSTDLLSEEISGLSKKKPLVFIDEIQKVPALLDDIQILVDEKKATFLLTGSSARKLYRREKLNLLPGRVINLRMDALSFAEAMPKKIEDVLYFGQLPEIFLNRDNKLKEMLLKSYVENYLDEEIRQEALVRNIGQFAKFIELAALESGHILNYSKISQELGPTVATITGYFQILKDCLLIDFIEPLSKSATRKRLTKSPRLLFFDMGVRRLAANEGAQLGQTRLGDLFEHQIGLELLKHSRNKPAESLHFWRDPTGPEVDWVYKKSETLIPIEVKFGSDPGESEAKHLLTFASEYKNSEPGIIVSQSPRKRTLKNGVRIIPWQELLETIG